MKSIQKIWQWIKVNEVQKNDNWNEFFLWSLSKLFLMKWKINYVIKNININEWDSLNHVIQWKEKDSLKNFFVYLKNNCGNDF